MLLFVVVLLSSVELMAKVHVLHLSLTELTRGAVGLQAEVLRLLLQIRHHGGSRVRLRARHRQAVETRGQLRHLRAEDLADLLGDEVSELIGPNSILGWPPSPLAKGRGASSKCGRVLL